MYIYTYIYMYIYIGGHVSLSGLGMALPDYGCRGPAQGQGCRRASYMLNTRRGEFLFIFSLLYEYTNLQYVHIHVIYRVHQAEYGIRMHEAAPQEYVNINSTRRVRTRRIPVGAVAYVPCEASAILTRRLFGLTP